MEESLGVLAGFILCFLIAGVGMYAKRRLM